MNPTVKKQNTRRFYAMFAVIIHGSYTYSFFLALRLLELLLLWNLFGKVLAIANTKNCSHAITQHT